VLFMQPEAARSERGLAQRLRVTLGLGESRRAVEQAMRTRQVALTSQSLPGRAEQRGKLALSTVWRLNPLPGLLLDGSGPPLLTGRPRRQRGTPICRPDGETVEIM
jgi:hypothetical protein